MLQKLLNTRRDCAIAVIRIVLGVVMFVHGAQKVLGWFGGSGFSATMSMFEDYMHIPAPFALLAVAAEFLGGLGLLIGLLGRVAAFGIAVEMIVAVVKVHFANGFFMNWTGNGKGEGIEYHLLVEGICVAIMMRGSGSLSVDGLLSRNSAAKP
jgi:putative oxidoreductase